MGDVIDLALRRNAIVLSNAFKLMREAGFSTKELTAENAVICTNDDRIQRLIHDALRYRGWNYD